MNNYLNKVKMYKIDWIKNMKIFSNILILKLFNKLKIKLNFCKLFIQITLFNLKLKSSIF